MLMLQQGDFSAMKILIGRYKKYVHDRFTFLGIYNDVAEEMTHEIFIRILENRLNYMPEKSRFKTWLTTIVNNLGKDHLRRKRKDNLLLMPLPCDQVRIRRTG
jgi:RNA polymerase sigma factor (sigma-70 family)